MWHFRTSKTAPQQKKMQSCGLLHCGCGDEDAAWRNLLGWWKCSVLFWVVVTHIYNFQNILNWTLEICVFYYIYIMPQKKTLKRIAGKMIKKNPGLDTNTYETLIWERCHCKWVGKNGLFNKWYWSNWKKAAWNHMSLFMPTLILDGSKI